MFIKVLYIVITMSNKGITQASKGIINKGTIVIRVYHKDWQKLKRIFPALKGESLARYLERYIDALKKEKKE